MLDTSEANIPEDHKIVGLFLDLERQPKICHMNVDLIRNQVPVDTCPYAKCIYCNIRDAMIAKLCEHASYSNNVNIAYRQMFPEDDPNDQEAR